LVFKRRFVVSRLSLISVLALGLVGCGKQVAQIPKATSDSVTSASFNVAGAPTVAFSVPDMMCPEGCGEKTKEILSEQAGAKEVVVDFDAKTATVAVEDGGKFDASAAVAALVDHGFTNSAIKAGATSEASAKPQAVEAKN
jgi:copper chaperone CopZ